MTCRQLQEFSLSRLLGTHPANRGEYRASTCRRQVTHCAGRRRPTPSRSRRTAPLLDKSRIPTCRGRGRERFSIRSTPLNPLRPKAGSSILGRGDGWRCRQVCLACGESTLPYLAGVDRRCRTGGATGQCRRAASSPTNCINPPNHGFRCRYRTITVRCTGVSDPENASCNLLSRSRF